MGPPNKDIAESVAVARIDREINKRVILSSVRLMPLISRRLEQGVTLAANRCQASPDDASAGGDALFVGQRLSFAKERNAAAFFDEFHAIANRHARAFRIRNDASRK